jgi:hypothetical protein
MEFRFAMKSISPGGSDPCFRGPFSGPEILFRKIFNNVTVSQT